MFLSQRLRISSTYRVRPRVCAVIVVGHFADGHRVAVGGEIADVFLLAVNIFVIALAAQAYFIFSLYGYGECAVAAEFQVFAAIYRLIVVGTGDAVFALNVEGEVVIIAI